MSAESPRNAATWRPAHTLAARAAREPLLQFLAIALVLFAANRFLHGGENRPAGYSITISQGRVLQIADSYGLLAGRMPTRAELQTLVDDFVDEEIDYREALAMGLDTDDTIIRRRMRQKLEFLAENADSNEEPTDAQLAELLKLHAAEYRLPERVSFRQVLASRDTRGPRSGADATALLSKLRSGEEPEKLSDASMLPAAMPLATAAGVAALFGDSFASSVFKHVGSGWFGPVGSPFGAHDVLVLSREPARNPALQEIRDKLRADWIESKRMARRDEFQARLRQRYQVQVEWPERYVGQPAVTHAPRIRHPIDNPTEE